MRPGDTVAGAPRSSSNSSVSVTSVKVGARRSVRQAELPSNDEVEDEVRAYLDLFCADTQPAELAALREVGTGSWLGRAHHGHGYGTEMRAAVLDLQKNLLADSPGELMKTMSLADAVAASLGPCGITANDAANDDATA